ncbi:hypothetical protein [Paracraurococcus lichenis]|uniref:Uncharacterized protein n=1 Tax=Paracraurococcus lichenis TaxID=3064888 RepID=A0ABT9EDJ4_9PROT|nr:hypothetical protein [Paracraurococcus sp. LOR1-02]MDO9714164.1 hypothetical protein [Paracraurococcus sp. LOR1-02]
MNVAQADRQGQQVAQDLDAPRYELRQISVRATTTWGSQVLVTASSNSLSSSRTAGEKTSSSAALALCFCWCSRSTDGRW